MGVGIDEDTYGGCYGHSQVIAQPIIADAFGAARGGQYVDGYSSVGHG